MKIKIKIKTLLLLIFVFVLTFTWLIPTTILGIANFLEYKSDKAMLFYEKYAVYPTTPKIKGGYLYANSLIKGFGKFTIFNNGWGGGENSPENISKAKATLENIMKETPSKRIEKEYYVYSYKLLLDMAIATGDIPTLHKWISFGQEINDEKIVYISDVYNGFLLNVNGDREEAKKIIEKYEHSNLADIKLLILKGETAIFDGNYEEAKIRYDEVRHSNWNPKEKTPFGSSTYYERSFWFERDIDDIKGNNIIKGSVTYEGKPMAFVEIYAQAAQEGLSFNTSGELYVGITDENGKFQTLGLKNGEYNIGIGVDSSILTDRVLSNKNYNKIELNGGDAEINFVFNKTFNANLHDDGKKISGKEFSVSWDTVEDADYYTVEVVSFSNYEKKGGAIFRSPIMDKNGETKIEKTSASFNIEMLRNQTGGMSFEGEEMILGPTAILGIFQPELEYPIVVNAYDENNNLITSTLPLRTYYDQVQSITVEGNLSDGEKLILNIKYPEAIEYYENILSQEPNNKEALKYLTKIYGLGWKNGEKNIKRAIELVNRYNDIFVEKMLFSDILGNVKTEEIKENMEYFHFILPAVLENLDEDRYIFLSRYYIASGKLEEARTALQNLESYVPDNLFYLNIYFGNYEEAVKNIESEKHYSTKMSIKTVRDALKAFEKYPPQFEDKEIFNNFLLKLVNEVNHSEGVALYDETIKQINDGNIKTILNEIYLERNWDISY